jgi:hypothetical protein
MSNDENSNETTELGKKAEVASNAVANVVSKALGLKESNPKVFFGAIGAVVVVILISMMSGGGGGPEKSMAKTKVVDLSIGATYELDAPKTSGDPDALVRLVAVPGSLAAFDDTDKKDRMGDCKHLPEGTKVKVLQVQKVFKTSVQAEIEILAGDCKGQKGWTFAINLK